MLSGSDLKDLRPVLHDQAGGHPSAGPETGRPMVDLLSHPPPVN